MSYLYLFCRLCSYKVGTLNAAETSRSAQQVHVMYDRVPHKLVAPRTARCTKWTFISTVALSKEHAERAYDEGQ